MPLFIYDYTETVTSWDHRSCELAQNKCSLRFATVQVPRAGIMTGALVSISNQHCLSPLLLTMLTSIHFVPSQRPAAVPAQRNIQMSQSGVLRMVYRRQKGHVGIYVSG